jgi:hypothetical protein
LNFSLHNIFKKYFFFSTILTTLTAFVIISTGLEILMKKFSEHKVSEQLRKNKNFLTSFSIIENTKSLFAPNTRLAALDTIRLLLVIHVHIAHAYGFRLSAGTLTLKKIFSQFLPKVFNENIYFFIRTPLMVDFMFTLRFDLEKSFIGRKREFFQFHFFQWFCTILWIIRKTYQN